MLWSIKKKHSECVCLPQEPLLRKSDQYVMYRHLLMIIQPFLFAAHHLIHYYPMETCLMWNLHLDLHFKSLLVSWQETQLLWTCFKLIYDGVCGLCCAGFPVKTWAAAGSHIVCLLHISWRQRGRRVGGRADTSAQFSLKLEVSACWKLSKTMTGTNAPGLRENNESTWLCNFPQFSSEWVMAAARLSLLPPDSREVTPGQTAPQGVSHHCCRGN